MIGDVVGQFVRRHDYFKFLCINLGIPNWTAPIVYLIGSGVLTDSIKGDSSALNVDSDSKSKKKNNCSGSGPSTDKES